MGTGSDGNGNYFSNYVLSGILLDGRSLAGVQVRDYDGGLSVVNPTAVTGNVRFISASTPEPGTLALLGLTVPVLRLIRRRKV